MATKYAIWNKKDPIITPSGAVYTAEEWKELYPAAKLDSVTVLCGAGEINGSLFGTLGQTVSTLELEGADFSSCTTDEEKVEVINAFLEEREVREAEEAEEIRMREIMQVDSLASIAASLEYQNMMSLPDVEV